MVLLLLFERWPTKPVDVRTAFSTLMQGTGELVRYCDWKLLNNDFQSSGLECHCILDFAF